MIYPQHRYVASSSQGFGKKGNRWLVLVALLLVVATGTIAFFLSDGFGFLNLQSLTQNDDLVTLWEGGEYDQLITKTEDVLERSPLNATALVFNGFAHFYRGINRVSSDENRQELQEAVVSLRKALLLDETPLQGRVHYVLAKAYYHTGRFYFDAAADHMEKALEAGYVGKDSHKYLGLAYAKLGDYQKSIASFRRAIEQNPTDLLYLTAAESYAELAEYENAERYLQRAIERSDDSYLKLRATFRLGEIHLERGNYQDAREVFSQLVEDHPRSADAHYMLGKAYAELGNDERARFEWRQTIEIDPEHSRALQSLQSN
jgi:tetratricopeptide (TPR) repeat protein